MLIPLAYARISRDRTGAGLGVARQHDDIVLLSGSLGLGNPERFSDNDLSAYKGKPRPGYRRLLARIREVAAAGDTPVVLAWHDDRLHRAPVELEGFIDAINAAGAKVHMVQGGENDYATSEGRLQARIKGSVARYESEHRSERVKAKMRQNAELGKPHGGTRAYGFEPDGRTVRPREAAVIDAAAARIIAGGTKDTLSTIAAELRRAHVPTGQRYRNLPPRPDGRISLAKAAWSAATLRQILVNPRIAGIRVHRGAEIGKGQWDAILTEETFRAVVAILTNPDRTTSPGNTPRYWLTGGVMACGACGAPIVSSTTRVKGVKVPAYKCSKPQEHVKKAMAWVDAAVETVVLRLLAAQDITARTPSPTGRPDLRARADRIRARMETLNAMLDDVDAELDPRQHTTRMRSLREQLEAVERQLALAPLPGPAAGVTPESWPRLPLERRRAVVRELMAIRLHPVRTHGKGLEAIEITPKNAAP